MAIRTGIGIGIHSTENLGRAINLATEGVNLQLSFFKKDVLDEYIYEAIKVFKARGLLKRMLAIHLPTNTGKLLVKDKAFASNLIKISKEFEPMTMNFVMHPNEQTTQGVRHLIMKGFKQYICIENFQWRKKKQLRSVLDIAEFVRGWGQAALCFDTSHTEDYYFQTPLLNFILKHTNVIHLSNRKGKDGHRPFNDQTADLPLIWMINTLLPLHSWNGVIILEYLEKHKHKFFKNLNYLNKLIEDSKKFIVEKPKIVF